MSDAIAEYQPRDMSDDAWVVIGPFVRAAVTMCEGKTSHKAQIMLGTSAGLSYWRWKIAGIPLENRYAFPHDIITWCTNHLRSRTDYTSSTSTSPSTTSIRTSCATWWFGGRPLIAD